MIFSLSLVSKEFHFVATENDDLWVAAERPYRALLDRYYCYDMVFECLGTDALQITARQRATSLARLFALDSPSEAFKDMQCIDRGAESFVYLGAHKSVHHCHNRRRFFLQANNNAFLCLRSGIEESAIEIRRADCVSESTKAQRAVSV